MIDQSDNAANCTHTADHRDRDQLAFAEGIVATTCLTLGAVSVVSAIATARNPRHLPLFHASLTGVMLSGGLSITWVLLDVARIMYRQSDREYKGMRRQGKNQHAELIDGFKASGQRYDELTKNITDFTKAQQDFTKVQAREAEVIGDVLQFQRRDEG